MTTRHFLQVGYFALMGVGLLLASAFLLMDKIDGGEWVAICGILFAADRAGNLFEKRNG